MKSATDGRTSCPGTASSIPFAPWGGVMLLLGTLSRGGRGNAGDWLGDDDGGDAGDTDVTGTLGPLPPGVAAIGPPSTSVNSRQALVARTATAAPLVNCVCFVQRSRRPSSTAMMQSSRFVGRPTAAAGWVPANRSLCWRLSLAPPSFSFCCLRFGRSLYDRILLSGLLSGPLRLAFAQSALLLSQPEAPFPIVPSFPPTLVRCFCTKSDRSLSSTPINQCPSASDAVNCG